MASQVETIKWIPGTRFIVDGFRFQSPQCSAYFLTHCHSDHTTGLTKRFEGGLIYCTPVSCRLLQHDMGLPPQVLRPLELDKVHIIDGVEVVPICANHCPGACMFLFKVPNKDGSPPQVILHTGDFRWDNEKMSTHPLLSQTKIDTLFLDTTYCAPKWTFPPQEETITAMVDFMQKELHAEGGVPLFVIGAYHIGKERAYMGAAHRLNLKVHTTPAKNKVLRLLGLPLKWTQLLVDSPEEAGVHVLGMGDQLHEQALADRIQNTKWSRVVAIRPTGWTYRRKGGLSVSSHGVVTTVGVPYSEHSSFEELRDCVRVLRPKKLVPTVNAGDAGKSRAIIDKLCAYMDLSEDKSRLDSYFKKGLSTKKTSSDGVECSIEIKVEEESVFGLETESPYSLPASVVALKQQISAITATSGDAMLQETTAMQSSTAALDNSGRTPMEDSQQTGIVGMEESQDAEVNIKLDPESELKSGPPCTVVDCITPKVQPPSATIGNAGTSFPINAQSAAAALGADKDEVIEIIDIDGIDVEEQQRILDAIAAAKRPPVSSGKLKQGSIKAFFQ